MNEVCIPHRVHRAWMGETSGKRRLHKHSKILVCNMKEKNVGTIRGRVPNKTQVKLRT